MIVLYGMILPWSCIHIQVLHSLFVLCQTIIGIRIYFDEGADDETSMAGPYTQPSDSGFSFTDPTSPLYSSSATLQSASASHFSFESMDCDSHAVHQDQSRSTQLGDSRDSHSASVSQSTQLPRDSFALMAASSLGLALIGSDASDD
jgi:hypothetical protein